MRVGVVMIKRYRVGWGWAEGEVGANRSRGY